MEEYLYKEETYDIIGCAMEVHNELGCGFLEPVYQEALSIVFREKNIPFVKEKSLDIKFKGQVLNKKYIADFICFDKIIIELKAIDTINSQHLAQVINYLKCTDKRLGLIINFGTSSLQYKRVIL
ncbi:MAG: GxxExxY protein [Bacteroidales bacterium]|nr:GxxExxY protein [Bacteroidales bacterium]MDD4673443.1 GxxExxY protein [Bacteroidales bacterium]MDY0348097.1 GxxExxY protein [Tenuifilaceae bacterium]